MSASIVCNSFALYRVSHTWPEVQLATFLAFLVFKAINDDGLTFDNYVDRSIRYVYSSSTFNTF